VRSTPEQQVLEYINEWNSNPDSPEGHCSFEYVALASEIRFERGIAIDDPERPARKVKRILEELENRGFVNRDWEALNGMSTSVRLTNSGHLRLESLRETVGWRRVGKIVVKVSEAILRSIIIPIIVALLTVVIASEFGIPKAQKNEVNIEVLEE
jgi:DNA-binding MarR family transcriptional regulator